VARIDPATGAIAKTLPAGIFGEASGPVELAVGDTDLWLAVPGRARSLIRLHLWNETSEGWPVPSSLLTEHDGALYTVGPDGGTLTVIRGNGSQPLGVLALTDGASWRDLAVGPDGTAWGVTSRGEGRTGSLVRQPLSEAGSRIPIPADPVGVTVGSTAAWVIGASGRTLTRVPTAALARHDPVHLTAAQLRINQRISQAAVQRLNVLTARVDGRPAPEPVAGRKRGRVRLTAEQLLINQRISQAAVRRANALAGRLEGVLHGTTAARPQGDAVTISARQLLIGQRIAQAAVRRANDLAARIPIFPFSWPEPEGPYLDKVNGTLETAGLGVITLTEAGWNGPMGDNAPFTAGDRMPVVFQDPQPAFAAGARIGAIGIVFGGVMFARYVSIEPAPDARG
jgi:hypothetical protein